MRLSPAGGRRISQAGGQEKRHDLEAARLGRVQKWSAKAARPGSHAPTLGQVENVVSKGGGQQPVGIHHLVVAPQRAARLRVALLPRWR